ncbi:acyl-CoA-binding domain-containing protein 4 isoform 3-T3 [Alca torda]
MEEAVADCGAQFRAAVQVIQGLPRSGSYRPSYEEMLRFYSYYKQATAGRCQGPRPGFWDPIGRYKWDAWHSLGRMSKEEAMAAYVAEMKKVAQKVIDTVPMDETTEEMFGYFEPLYDVIHDMPRPPEAFFKRKRGSQEQTANRSQDDPASSPAPERPKDALPEEQQNGPHVPDLQLAGGEQDAESTQGLPAQLDAHVAGTVRALQDDMRQVLERLSELETLASAQGNAAGTDPGHLLAPQVSWRWWHDGCDKDRRAVTGARCHRPFSRGLGGMSGHTGATFVPLPTPPLSVPSPGNAPMAPDRLPAHPALPHRLALRHPVAAAPLAGQDEVTAASPVPPPAPSRDAGCHHPA